YETGAGVLFRVREPYPHPTRGRHVPLLDLNRPRSPRALGAADRTAQQTEREGGRAPAVRTIRVRRDARAAEDVGGTSPGIARPLLAAVQTDGPRLTGATLRTWTLDRAVGASQPSVCSFWLPPSRCRCSSCDTH